MEIPHQIRDKWYLVAILVIGAYSVYFSQRGIIAFLLGFQDPPPLYAWIIVTLVYGTILAAIEASPQLKPSSRTPKIILVLVVSFTLVVVLFSLPFAFQPSPDAADDLRIVVELRVSDSSGQPVDIADLDIYCEPIYTVLRAGDIAYFCTSDESSLFDSSVILDSFENDLNQTSVVGLEWKHSRRTRPEYTSELTTRDVTSSFSIVAPASGAFYHSVSVDRARIERLINRGSAEPLNVSAINAGAYTNTVEPQRVYDEGYLTGSRFQNLNIVVGLFAFISIWLSTFSVLHTLNEDGNKI